MDTFNTVLYAVFNSQKLYVFVRHDDISSYFEVLSIFFVCVGRNI